MKRAILAVAVSFLFLATPAFAQDHVLPDRDKTPGVALLTVPDGKAAACIADLIGGSVETGDAISTTMICQPNYSKCIRNVSQATKREVYEAYGDPEGNHHGYCDVTQGCEVDHLISIEIGGSNDASNLWPEPYSGMQWNAHVKDRLENWYHANVCNGRISLKTAQDEISSDWVAAFKKRIGDSPNSETQ